MIERYSRPEMAKIWSDQNRHEKWLEIELQVCLIQENNGIIPKGTSKKLSNALKVDAKRILNIEQTVRHDVIAFLTHLEEQHEDAKYLHFSMTSSDVLDTAFTMQLREAGKKILNSLKSYMVELHNKVNDYKYLPTIGRTHGIHAEPTSLGLIFAGFYTEMFRNFDRLNHAIEFCVGKISGAVGNYGLFLKPHEEFNILRNLGIEGEECATQVVARDRYAEFFNALALIASAIERFALQIRHWQRTEVGEVCEGFSKDQRGSSAMPHKKNPILSENLCGLARLVRGYANTSLENISLWHERDISHSSVERIIGPDATILVDFMLHRVTDLLKNLVINEKRISENLQKTKGLVFSGALLLKMVQKGLSRNDAYKIVQSHAMKTLEQGSDFYQICINSNEILEILSVSEIGDCFNVNNYLQNVDLILERIFFNQGKK